MRIATKLLTASSLVAILWYGCSETNNPSGGGNAYSCNCMPILISEQTYRLIGTDSVELFTPMTVDTFRSCDGSTSIATPDTTEADTIRLRYSLRNDSLLLSTDEISGVGQYFGSIVLFLAFSRKGSGSGLEGTWNVAGLAYEDPDSTLNSVTRAIADSIVRAMSKEFEDSLETYMVISSNTVREYEKNSIANEILDQWAGQSANYSIVAGKHSECEVTFSGNISGEMVNVCGANGKEIRYRSSNEEHEMHTYYLTNPVRCPNDKYPLWWEEFLETNKNE